MSPLPGRVVRALRRRGGARLVAAAARAGGRAPDGLRMERLGSSYGGYWLPAALPDASWLCLSGGVGEDTTFDDEILRRWGATVVAADPTERAAAHCAARADVGGTFTFVPAGLWSEDTTIEFFPPSDPSHVSYSAVNLQDTTASVSFPVLSVPSALAAAGADPDPARLDLLKVDIEGSEHTVVADALERGYRPAVICLEIDQPCPLRTALATVRRVRDAGYVLAKADGWTHTWVRRDVRPGGPIQRVADLEDRSPQARARAAARAGVIEAARVADAVRPGPDPTTPRVQHVFWHHVFDDERAGFEAQLDALAEAFDVVGYDAAVDATLTGPIDRPMASISFDDGLASCRTAGDLLARRGISACFFVLTDLVGEADERVRAQVCRERLAMPDTEFLGWDDLEALVAQGHLIGSHGRSHQRFATLSPDELDDELGTSRDVLLARLGTVDHLAWPYGHLDDAPADIVARARAAGYRSAAANVRGCHLTPIGADGPVLRDHALANWPPRQLRWFLDRNLRRAAAP